MDCLYLARLLAVHAVIWVFENCQSVTVIIYVIKAPVTWIRTLPNLSGRFAMPCTILPSRCEKRLATSMHYTEYLAVIDMKGTSR